MIKSKPPFHNRGGRGPSEAPGGCWVPEQGPISNPTPYTLYTAPYALHPTPCTLRPTPRTLHRTPYILHPATHTLFPAPYTPQPTAYTLHAQIGDNTGLQRYGSGRTRLSTLHPAFWMLNPASKILDP